MSGNENNDNRSEHRFVDASEKLELPEEPIVVVHRPASIDEIVTAAVRAIQLNNDLGRNRMGNYAHVKDLLPEFNGKTDEEDVVYFIRREGTVQAT